MSGCHVSLVKEKGAFPFVIRTEGSVLECNLHQIQQIYEWCHQILENEEEIEEED